MGAMNWMRISFLLPGVLLLLAGVPVDAADELVYPAKDFAKLDTFEGLNLEDADKLFTKGDFAGAFAAYKAYAAEFPKSKASSYAMLRMGRCLHKLDKRNAAIKAYQEVVDYFPDDVPFAAAALYHIGECHGQNGEEAKKTSVWAKMVKDDGYVTQPNSGTALAYLGTAMEKAGKFEEAAEYQWRTAVAFLKSNPQAAATARDAVLVHFATRAPNHEKLKEFYVAASGFDGRGEKVTQPEEDARYWTTVLSRVLKMEGDAAAKEQACAYWSAKMGDRFVEADGLRKLWFDTQFVAEKSKESWVARMEKQFKTKPATIDRVLQWCDFYPRSETELRSAFFATHAKELLGGLKPAEKIQLVNRLTHPLGMAEEARVVLATISPEGMDDQALRDLAFAAAAHEPEDGVLRYFSRMKDPVFAAKSRFDYYRDRSHRNNPFKEKALAEIPVLQKSPQYAEQVLSWEQGQLLHGLGRYEEAIKAYRASNKEPDASWEIGQCLEGLKRFPEAIKTYQELESVGGGTASRAALEIANVYLRGGDKGKEVDQLRLVLRRYPKSPQSSEAHTRLERYGVKLIGGEAEAQK
jgi:tetratricopeptide (TPR) repeat protein